MQPSYATRHQLHCRSRCASKIVRSFLPSGHFEAFDELLDLPDLHIAIRRRLLGHGSAVASCWCSAPENLSVSSSRFLRWPSSGSFLALTKPSRVSCTRLPADSPVVGRSLATGIRGANLGFRGRNGGAHHFTLHTRLCMRAVYCPELVTIPDGSTARRRLGDHELCESLAGDSSARDFL